MKEKEEVLKAGLRLVEDGLIARTWGNISARAKEGKFVITPSGRTYDSLKPEDIVTVRAENLSYEGVIKPSSEKGVHAASYLEREDVGFVIHTHQNYATALSTLGRDIDVTSIDPEAVAVLGPTAPCAGYGMNGTKTLTGNVRRAIHDNPKSTCVLMRNHGVLCLGKNMEDAFHIAHVLEDVSETYYQELTGMELPEKTVENYDLMSYGRVLERPKERPWRADKINCIIETRAPFILEASSYGKPMPAYIDDLAMIGGISIPVLPAHASHEEIRKAIKGTTGAVFLRGKGAVSMAASREDAEAMVMVLDKCCRVFVLAKTGSHPHVVSLFARIKEHSNYINSYSKLESANSQ
ncbi:MAG: class II aldolase/adducin family protein [Lachnospiraceae bacterium]|nr:class II aldolase/adducin family protein [Lachnospiraceae bacterium]